MAITVTFSNINADFDTSLEAVKPSLENMETPACVAYTEDIAALRTALDPFQKYQNILLVANGGSVWSFMAYYTALVDRVHGKTVVPLTDMEPDYLAIVKQKYSVDTTLVLVISKSGSTVGTIENLFAFSEYPQLYVTDLDSPLGQIGKARGVPVIKHPPVGGRYSGFTSCAYAPAILTGLPVEQIEKGARDGYDRFEGMDGENPALNTALAMWQLDQKGYTEVFLPIYSNFLQVFGMQVTQLFHESFGKDGKGLSVIAAQAPESQHHTNQRFFGGRKNMIACFLRAKKQHTDMTITVPTELSSVAIRTGTLGDLNGLSLARSFEAEYIGTLMDAKNNGIPIIDISVEQVDGYHVGVLLAFWHYVTIYSSLVRGVDPYDQPQVEGSKVISFEERLHSQV